MQVEVYTRHTPGCQHRANRFSRRCNCRKWLAIVGADKRISAKTRSWEQAEKRAKEMEGGVLPAADGIRKSVAAYLADKAQQNVSRNFARKLQRELADFSAWCDSKALLAMPEVTLHALERHRQTWNGSPITRRKRQERLRSFFAYCQRHGWVKENVARHLSIIKVQMPPTLPLTREQFEAVMQAVESYDPMAPDREWRRQRARAMLLLLRWSGLRIGDAARLERSALTDRGALRLYTQKTGEGVYVPLPPQAVTALREIQNENPRYFFWNGRSALDSPGKRWWSTLKKIFRAAGIANAHPHQLRDMFSVELLLAGVPIEQVSILLGHASIRVTQKSYAPWVKARQEQLEESVRKAWT